MSSRSYPALLTGFSLTVFTLPAPAGTAVGIYDIFNKGVIPFTEGVPVSDLREDRLDVIHDALTPRVFYRPRFDSSAGGFVPYYTYPARATAYATSDWSQETYGAWQSPSSSVLQNPFVDPQTLREPGRHFGYLNVHVQPGLQGSFTPGPGPQTEFGLFAPRRLVTSADAGSALSENGGTVSFARENNFSSTDFGRARGTITPQGEIKLRLDLNPNQYVATVPSFGPAEAVIQGSYASQLIIDAVTPTNTVEADLSFGARVTAPVLDFRLRDFYSYGVGYSVAVIERRAYEDTAAWQQQVDFYRENAFTFGISEEQLAEMTEEELLEIADPDMLLQRQAPAIIEHWSARGLYWMEARQDTPPSGFGPRHVRIESIGSTPPPDTVGLFGNYAYDGGITATDIALEGLPGTRPEGPEGDNAPIETATLLKHVREFSYDPNQDPVPDAFGNLPWIYRDPMMPFAQYVEETAVLPTQTVLEVVANFFIAGAVGREFVGSCPVNTSSCGVSEDPDFIIDGSHTAGFGIGFRDPGITVLSSNGFSFPTRALPTVVPLPAAWPLFACALGGLAWRTRRRGGA